ncbi:MAG: hypothetical protein M5U15_15360 [Kiritimatiellae bacterium]|nr:hypothetical protein [Kiritimatiellia bacterium]
MKKYLAVIALGTLIAPAVGATIYGALLGNPFIIFAPVVLAVPISLKLYRSSYLESSAACYTQEA